MIEEDGSLCRWQCSQCEKEKEIEQRAKKAAADRERFFYAAMHRPYANFCHIPKRFKAKTVDNYNAVSDGQKTIKSICQRYTDNFSKVQERGTSMIFCGKPGTGKTHLAYGIVNVLQEQKVKAAFTTAADMTSSVKTAIREPYEDNLSARDVTDEYARLELLVIDEVGVQVDSDAERRIFFDIINKRYEEMMPTILLSNLIIDELTKFIGERVADRMRENGGTVFAFDWESHRG
jgi:DNA replication protein DnaC